jgi:signal transduction histidine kinase
MVECVLAQINQVIMNILVNAGHAVEKEGVIRISTSCDGQAVCIRISDNGKGIKETDINKIFDPFFTTKPVGKGTGLGLSISFGIIQKHHGSIDVKSKPGEGATFEIRLPIRQSGSESTDNE